MSQFLKVPKMELYLEHDHKRTAEHPFSTSHIMHDGRVVYRGDDAAKLLYECKYDNPETDVAIRYET